jgi:hypothetical protein
MPSRPSDEDERRRRAGVLLLACEELMREMRRAGTADSDWRVGVLRRLRKSLVHDLESSTA